MTSPRATGALIATVITGLASSASAQMWKDVTELTIGETAEWSNKVELADLDGDGDVDIIFANGGDYSTAGARENNRVFLNDGSGKFDEATEQVLGTTGDLARVIKVRDVSSDGIVDIVVGGGHQTQARLYLGRGAGRYDEVTTTHLPQGATSMGDLEIGDIDGDGDLDLVAADWGPGDAMRNDGGGVIVWLNRGDGRFEDASTQVPADKIKMSWDLELIDVDNDYDLDLLVSCKMCADSLLYTNDGRGFFTTRSFNPGNEQPRGVENNYEFEWLDINGDGFLDVVTINDGLLDDPGNELDLRERVFVNDRSGGFVDATERLWPAAANIGADDNAVVVLDADSDGDPDFLIAALGDEPDRLLINDGAGNLSMRDDVFGGSPTTGTLGIAVADLNGDGKLDVVQSQGELADDERVYFGDQIAVDSAGPVVSIVERVDTSAGGTQRIRARVHDNKTPVMPHDFRAVELVTGSGKRVAMRWYGEGLWRVDVELAVDDTYTICAVDAADNETCSAPPRKDDNIDDPIDAPAGCAAATPATGALPIALLLALALLARRRRSHAIC